MERLVDCDSNFEWAEYVSRNSPLEHYPEHRPRGVRRLRDVATRPGPRKVLVVLSGLSGSGHDLAAEILREESGERGFEYTARSAVSEVECFADECRARVLCELADVYSRYHVRVVYLRVDPCENYRRLTARWHGQQEPFAEHLRRHRLLEAQWAPGIARPHPLFTLAVDAPGKAPRAHWDARALVDEVRALVGDERGPADGQLRRRPSLGRVPGAQPAPRALRAPQAPRQTLGALPPREPPGKHL